MFTSGYMKEHACAIVTSGNKTMCLIGDLANHPFWGMFSLIRHYV